MIFPNYFLKCQKPHYKYPTNFSNLNCNIKNYYLKIAENSVSFRRPNLWENILDKKDKEKILVYSSKRK